MSQPAGNQRSSLMSPEFNTESSGQPPQHRNSETERLHDLWKGRFGDQYTERNLSAAKDRGEFWKSTLLKFPASGVLEVGCNVGANLRWVSELLPHARVDGVDINHGSLLELRRRHPEIGALMASALRLPFAASSHDLVFTSGVLIHQPTEALQQVMSEVVRCAGRFVLCIEYYAPSLEEVEYRGQRDALFKRDYGGLYRQMFPHLSLIAEGFLGRESGDWDDVNYWVFEVRTESP